MWADLLQFFGNDKHYFNSDSLTILLRGPELPLLQRGEDELGAGEGLREDDAEVLKAAGLIDKAADHHGVGVNITGREVGPHNVIRPWRFKAGDGASGGGLRVAWQRVLQNPALGQTDV